MMTGAPNAASFLVKACVIPSVIRTEIPSYGAWRLIQHVADSSQVQAASQCVGLTDQRR